MEKRLIAVKAPEGDFDGFITPGQKFAVLNQRRYFITIFFDFIIPEMYKDYGCMSTSLTGSAHLSGKDWILIHNTDVKLPFRIKKILRNRKSLIYNQSK